MKPPESASLSSPFWAGRAEAAEKVAEDVGTTAKPDAVASSEAAMGSRRHDFMAVKGSLDSLSTKSAGKRGVNDGPPFDGCLCSDVPNDSSDSETNFLISREAPRARK